MEEFSLKPMTKTKKRHILKSDPFNNYARFIADLISDKVIYSKELDSFLIVKTNNMK